MTASTRLVLIALFATCIYMPARAAPTAPSTHFEPNRGQVDEQVAFYARPKGYQLFLTKNAAVWSMRGAADEQAAVWMRLLGSNPKPEIEGSERDTGVSHYYLGHDQGAWHENVPHFKKVVYRDVYPGIDLIFRANGSDVEYDLLVRPGADPNTIVLAFEGPDHIHLDQQGNLLTSVGGNGLVHRAPRIFQEINGQQRPIAGRFNLDPKRKQVRFEVEAYDRKTDLLIDPALLVYATYFGGDGAADAGHPYVVPYEGVVDIAADHQGNATITGHADALDFPVSPGAYQSICRVDSINRCQDVFVAKLNADGTDILYSTYFGGDWTDQVFGMGIDGSGQVTIAGEGSWNNFPLLNEPWDESTFTDVSISSRSYIARFSQSGALLFSTFFCAQIMAMTVSDGGDILITGRAGPPDNPATPDEKEGCFPAAWENQYRRGGNFTARLTGTPSLVNTAWHGGGKDIEIDSSGRVYLLVNRDTIVKLTPNFTDVEWQVGFQSLRINAIAVDQFGSVYFTGTARYDNVPVTQDAFQPTFLGLDPSWRSGTGHAGDAFVVKLSSDGTGVVYGTYLGGIGSDEGLDIAVDRGGSAWVTGWYGRPNLGHYSNDPEFPEWLPGAWNAWLGRHHVGGGWRDLFLARLNPQGTDLVFSVGYGGLHHEQGRAIALDSTGSAYVGGFTRSYDTHVGRNAFQPALAGGGYNRYPSDGFVMKVHEDTIFTGFPPDTPRIMFFDSSAEEESAGDDADPVSTYSGELWSKEAPDLTLGGPMPLSFSRFYGSAFNNTTTLGNNWRHNFLFSFGQDNSSCIITNGRGRRIYFWRNGNVWQQTGPVDVPHTLEESGTDWVLVDQRDEKIYTFDANGFLTTIADGRGNIHSLTYVGNSVSQVSDGLGRAIDFTYGGTGLLTSVSDGTRTVSFGYNGNNLASVTDVMNKVTTFSYDTAHIVPGLMTTRTYPGSGTMAFTQTYNADGQVATQTNAVGDTHSFTYGTHRTDITSAGQVTTHIHDDKGNLVAIRDPANNTIEITSDGYGRRNQITDRNGNVSTRAIQSKTGRPELVTRPGNVQHRSELTARTGGSHTFYDLERQVNPDGTSVQFAYDSNGNNTQITDEAGEIWSYTYNANGQPLTATTPLGGTTTYAYNTDGTIASVTDHSNNTITYGYDALGRQIASTYPGGVNASVTLNDAGQILTATDRLGRVTSYTYNDSGNLTSVTTPAGTTSFTYDLAQRLETITDPINGVSTFTYDALGRVETITSAGNDTITYGYDAVGDLVSITDGGNQVWTRTYDDDQRLIAVTNPLTSSVSFTYDRRGNIVAFETALGNRTDLTWDDFSHLTHVSDPLGNVATYDYGPRGLLAHLARGGSEISYLRNGLGQVTSATDPNGNAWLWDFDPQGRLLTATDPVGNAIGFSYDDKNRPSRITYPGGGTQDLTYDDANNVLRRLYSDGTDLTFGYDTSQARTSATGLTLGYDAAGNISSSNGLTIGRDGAGRISSVTFASGKTVQYSYNSRNLVQTITDWVGGSTTLGYDAAKRMTSLTRPNGVVTTYSYDDEDRVTTITDNDGSDISVISLVRDPRGLVSSATRNVPNPATATGQTDMTATYDTAQRRVGATYDQLGRVTDDGTRTYVWDLADRLTSVTEGATTVSATYDAFGLMVSQAGASTRQYVWNYAFSLPSVSVMRDASNDLVYYVHTPGGDLLYSIDASDSRRFYHFDEAGSTLFLTNDSASITDTYAYAPYGALLASSGASENPFTYHGRVGVMAEPTTGLYRMRKRVYDSGSRRFLSRDPAPDPFRVETINPYLFAAANPLRYADPMGEAPNPADESASKQLLDVGNQLGGKVKDAVGTWAGRQAGQLEDRAKGIQRINRANLLLGKKGGNTIKAQQLLNQSSKYKRLEKGLGKIGLVTDTYGKATKGVAAAKKILSAADRYQAANEVAKDYIHGKAKSKAEDFIKKKVGNKVFGVYNAGKALYETHQKVEAVTNQTASLHDANLQSHYAQMDAVIESLKKGWCTQEEAEERIRHIAATFDESTAGTRAAGNAGIGIESLRGGINAILAVIGL